MHNVCQLMGNLGKDPEIRELESGKKVAKFPLATSERWKDGQGNKQEKTEWHQVVVWGGLADVAEKYLKKGSRIFLEGKISYRSWDDNDGNKRYSTEIVARNFQMIDKKEDANNEGANQSAPSSTQETAPQQPNINVEAGKAEDDLPF